MIRNHSAPFDRRSTTSRITQLPALWVPKMPSESFMPKFLRIDEFNFDLIFVYSDNSASHSLGQTSLHKIRRSFRYGPFGLFRRINLIAPIRFLRLDMLLSVFGNILTEPS